MASVRVVDGDRVDQRPVLGELGRDLRLVAKDLEPERAVLAARARHPGDHHRRADISTHGVNRDARAHVHACGALVRDAAQASVETISRPL